MVDIVLYIITGTTLLTLGFMLWLSLRINRTMKRAIKNTERLKEIIGLLPSEKPADCPDDIWSEYQKTTAELEKTTTEAIRRFEELYES